MRNYAMFINYSQDMNQYDDDGCSLPEIDKLERLCRAIRCNDWIAEKRRKKQLFSAKMESQMNDYRRVKKLEKYPSEVAERRAFASVVAAVIQNPDRMDLMGELFHFRAHPDFYFKNPELRETIANMKMMMQLRVGDTWRNVPWHNEMWWRNSPWRMAHAAHYSKKQNGMLAYQETADKTRRDIQSVMAPGRYLNRYFGSVLSVEQIKMWSEKFTAYADQSLKLEFLNNDTFEGDEGELQDEWVRLYDEVKVDYSCMRGEDCVRVYGMNGNHLGLAYLKAGDGTLMCRSVVRFDKMKYVRAYPYTKGENIGSVNADQFERMLEDAGFTRGDLNNIKVLREEDYDGIVMPYIDGDACCVEDCGNYMLIGHDGVDAQNTSGYVEDNRCTCDECGDSMCEDDSYWIDSEDIRVCEYCRDREFVYAHGRRHMDYYRESACVEIRGEWYVEEWIGNHDIFYCDECGEYFHLDHHADTEDAVCIKCAVDLDVEHDGYAQAVRRDTVTLSDGRVVHEDDADELQAEIDAERETTGVVKLVDCTPREANHELQLAS